MTDDTSKDITPEYETEETKKLNFWRDLLQRLFREKPLGVVGLVIVVVLLFAGIFADLSWLGLPDIGIAPYPMSEIHLADRLQPPSGTYWLGTDNLGQDVLSEIIFGARISVIIGLCATALNTVVSFLLGATSALVGGKFDMIVQRFVDAWMCIPNLLFLLTVMSIVGRGVPQLIIIIGVQGGIGYSRLVRSAVYRLKGNVYVEAAEACGSTTWALLIRHILPNVLSILIIHFSIGIGGVIMMESSLSFLGFGVPPGTPTWGSMLAQEGRAYMEIAPQLAIWPGVALSLVIYGCNMLGDALRDLLDPRLRGGLGRYGTATKKMQKQKEAAEATA